MRKVRGISYIYQQKQTQNCLNICSEHMPFSTSSICSLDSCLKIKKRNIIPYAHIKYQSISSISIVQRVISEKYPYIWIFIYMDIVDGCTIQGGCADILYIWE